MDENQRSAPSVEDSGDRRGLSSPPATPSSPLSSLSARSSPEGVFVKRLSVTESKLVRVERRGTCKGGELRGSRQGDVKFLLGVSIAIARIRGTSIDDEIRPFPCGIAWRHTRGRFGSKMIVYEAAL